MKLSGAALHQIRRNPRTSARVTRLAKPMVAIHSPSSPALAGTLRISTAKPFSIFAPPGG
jgi:hypothetical protein